MRKGFTLVELAIVLVIIGLLIGGILVATSMINTSNLLAQVAQIQQFDAGVQSFKAKYGFMPGDSPAMGGDGNGLIARPSSGAYPLEIETFSTEIANFWSNLNPDQFTGTSSLSIVGVQAQYTDPGKRVPLAKMGSRNSFWIASANGLSSNNGYADSANPANYYFAVAGTSAQALSSGSYYINQTGGGGAWTSNDLFLLDTKIDDGLATTGSVISGSVRNGLNSIITYTGCNGNNTPVYLHTNGYNCTPMIRIGGLLNDPQ